MVKTKKVPEACGHDIIIWQKAEDKPTWACGYTAPGSNYLRVYNTDYVQGRAMKLTVVPDVFMADAPKNLNIGGMGPSKQVFTIRSAPLH